MTAPLDTDIRRGFLLAEDEALKAKLSNIMVASPRSPGGVDRVQVWFAMPEHERERHYPFITIELIDISFANDRAHSAQITPIDYWPSEYATIAEYLTANGINILSTNGLPEAVWWHPYNLTYQITTHARSALHDRQLTAALLGTAYLPDRWGYLHVPADQSERWLDRVGYSTEDYYETTGAGSKRVFRKVYNVVVSAHFPPENPLIYFKVLHVAGTLQGFPDTEINDTWANP